MSAGAAGRTIDRSRDRVALPTGPSRGVLPVAPRPRPPSSPLLLLGPRPRGPAGARRVDRQGRDRRRARRRPQRPLQVRRRGHRGRGPQAHVQRRQARSRRTRPGRAVKAAAQGASVFVYLGHGNGWPSIYPPFQTVTKDGLGLDPQSRRRRRQARLLRRGLHPEQHPARAQRGRPAVPPVLRVGEHRARARRRARSPRPGERVDNYGAGFIGAGARAVIAEGHPDHPATSEIRQLFTTNRTMDQVFRTAPTWHGHLQGPFASQRTPGPRATSWTPTPRRRRASTARSSATSALPGVGRDGRAAGADRRDPGGLRGPRRRRGRRGGRRRAVRLAGEGRGPGGDGRRPRSPTARGCG